MNPREWLRKLGRREQLCLLAAGFALVLYLPWVAVWQPLSGARDDMALRNARASGQLARVRSMAAELRALRAAGGRVQERDMNQLIEGSIGRFGIRPSRMRSDSRGETRIRFEEVGFAELMRWLHRVESVEGMLVREVSISRGDRGGSVRAAVRLARPG